MTEVVCQIGPEKSPVMWYMQETVTIDNVGKKDK